MKAADPRELCVVVSCHELVCALPARNIERLVLAEDVSVVVGGRDGRAGQRTWQVVLVGEQRYAACNLGTHLGMGPVDAAWALLRIEHRGMELPIALQTGPCLVVQALGPGVALPRGAFRARGGAVAAAFRTTALKSHAPLAEVGLHLDLERLWVDTELDAAVVALGDEAEPEERRP